MKTKGIFDDLTRNEFIQLLTEAGFEVEDGEGKLIFTDECDTFGPISPMSFSCKDNYISNESKPPRFYTNDNEKYHIRNNFYECYEKGIMYNLLTLDKSA